MVFSLEHDIKVEKIIREHGSLTLPFEKACVFMSEMMFTICGFFQYGGLVKLFTSS
jgi:hypothetical protein